MNADGFKGGLIWSWGKGFEVIPWQLTSHWLHLQIKLPDGSTVAIIAIYGPLKLANKLKLWEFIQETSEQMNFPWLLIGDFNQVGSTTEKHNNTAKTDRAIEF